MEFSETTYFPLLCGPEFLPSQACEMQKVLSGREDLKRYADNQNWLWRKYMDKYLAKPGIAVIVTDTFEKIVWINRGFSKMTGYKLAEIKGLKPSEFLQGDGTSDETRRKLRSGINKLTDCSDKILNYRKNGEPYWCKLDIWPLYNQKEELVNFIAFEREIWDRDIRMARSVLAS